MTRTDFDKTIQNDVPRSRYVVGISGVPGAGKTTLTDQLFADFDLQAGMVRSLTTRGHRGDDRGNEYEYISVDEFERLEKAGQTTWRVSAHGQFYGNTFTQFAEALRNFMISAIAITPETLLEIYKLIPKERLRLFHLEAPSEQEQRRRMKERGECDRAIEHRIATSRMWEAQVYQIRSSLPHDITVIGQSSPRDMYMEFLNSLDLPAG